MVFPLALLPAAGFIGAPIAGITASALFSPKTDTVADMQRRHHIAALVLGGLAATSFLAAMSSKNKNIQSIGYGAAAGSAVGSVFALALAALDSVEITVGPRNAPVGTLPLGTATHTPPPVFRPRPGVPASTTISPTATPSPSPVATPPTTPVPGSARNAIGCTGLDEKLPSEALGRAQKLLTFNPLAPDVLRRPTAATIAEMRGLANQIRFCGSQLPGATAQNTLSDELDRKATIFETKLAELPTPTGPNGLGCTPLSGTLPQPAIDQANALLALSPSSADARFRPTVDTVDQMRRLAIQFRYCGSALGFQPTRDALVDNLEKKAIDFETFLRTHPA